MSPEYLPRNVKRETEDHYKNRWPFAADARRNLYLKFARRTPAVSSENFDQMDWDNLHINHDQETYDMWQNIAQDVINIVGDGETVQGLDVGASSGYFIQKLLDEGYRGRIFGVDIETGTQPGVETIIRMDHPEANLVLGGSDAQKLKCLEYYDDNNVLQKEDIPENYFDFVTELFVLYHVPNVKKAYNAAHRVVKPDGLVVFSGRNELNQKHLWSLGAVVAANFGVRPPDSFYRHHNLVAIENHLDASPKYELIKAVPQYENLWIPKDEGWIDYKLALMTLPYGRDPKSGKMLSNQAMSDFIEAEIRPQYENQAEKNNGYFLDYVWQKYFVCRAIK